MGKWMGKKAAMWKTRKQQECGTRWAESGNSESNAMQGKMSCLSAAPITIQAAWPVAFKASWSMAFGADGTTAAAAGLRGGDQ